VPEPLRFDEVSAARPRTSEANGRIRVIVKVRKPGYVPEGFMLRTRVDDLLFTAEARDADVVTASADPDVESVERGAPLRLP
jgi:hypothetical protein